MLPLLSAEIYSHISEGHWSLQGNIPFQCERLALGNRLYLGIRNLGFVNWLPLFKTLPHHFPNILLWRFTNIQKNFKELYSENLYIHHLGSITNVLLCLFYHTLTHPFIHLSIHLFCAFQKKNCRSVHFLLHSSEYKSLTRVCLPFIRYI